VVGRSHLLNYFLSSGAPKIEYEIHGKKRSMPYSKVLDYYGIKEKLWLGITDNAQTEAGAIAKAGLEWEPCVVHTLDLRLTLQHAATAAEDSISCTRNLAAVILKEYPKSRPL
jgi:hypothetical protein